MRWVSVGGGLTAESVASMAEARGEARSAAPTHNAAAAAPAPVHLLTLHRQTDRQTDRHSQTDRHTYTQVSTYNINR